MFHDLEEKLDSFYDLPEQVSDALLQEINQRARQNPDTFKQYMQAMGFGADTDRSIFYEAIWAKPKGFEVYFLEEMQQLLQLAGQGIEEAVEDVDSLFYLVPKEAMTADFYTKSKALLSPYIASPTAAVRENVAEIILDLQHEDLISLDATDLKKLQRLLYDPVFEVRNSVFVTMEELGLLPPDFRRSLGDKMRKKLGL